MIEKRGFIEYLGDELRTMDSDLRCLIKEVCISENPYMYTDMVILSFSDCVGYLLKVKNKLNEKESFCFPDNNPNIQIDTIMVQKQVFEKYTNIVNNNMNSPIYKFDINADYPRVKRYGFFSNSCPKDVIEIITKEENYISITDKEKMHCIVIDGILLNSCLIYTRVYIDKFWYNNMISYCDTKEKEKQLPEYYYFFDKMVENYLDKRKEIMYYGLSSCTFTNNSIKLLTATDMLESRALPEENIITRISNEKYEGEACYGKMAFIDDIESENLDCIFEDRNFVSLDNIRTIRKMLEMTKTDAYLMINRLYNCEILGLKKLSNEELIGAYVIEFLGFNSWKLSCGNNGIVEYRNGMFYVPEQKIREDYIKRKLNENFNNNSNNEGILKILKALSDQKHGTMLVIDEDAGRESSRLISESAGIRVEIEDLSMLDDKVIEAISSIDGAIMISPKCCCNGIGLILKSDEKVKGNPARGARFNSALAYKAKRNKENKKCVVIVFSEDGMVNIVEPE